MDKCKYCGDTAISLSLRGYCEKCEHIWAKDEYGNLKPVDKEKYPGTYKSYFEMFKYLNK